MSEVIFAQQRVMVTLKFIHFFVRNSTRSSQLFNPVKCSFFRQSIYLMWPWTNVVGLFCGNLQGIWVFRKFTRNLCHFVKTIMNITWLRHFLWGKKSVSCSSVNVLKILAMIVKSYRFLLCIICHMAEYQRGQCAS